ncbi:MAG TPA: class IV adenylate cyclase [Candidatus Saccharimonadales bacterium]|nr:class IV adenylate cyclase [Candidatus Saccharimonadales bacterium]
MREIEIKARTADKKAFIDALIERGVAVSDPVTQHDRVFGVAGVDGDDGDNAAPWLRIRTETKQGATKHIFTLKKSVTNQMDSIEHETEIADETELEKIIEHIGFVPFSDLTKTRQKAHFGEIELCIDTVDGLGDFVEAEKLTDEDADYDTVANELWKVLEECGVSRDDYVTEGYDVLMNKQRRL